MKNILSLFLVLFSFFEVSAWELKKDSEGIQVYTRSVQGSQIKEFKGVTVYKGSLKSAVAVMQDSGVFCSWFPDCREFKLLKIYSPVNSVGYMTVKAPFPVTDRDSITQSVLTQDKKTKAVRISLDSLPEFIPEKSGLVRVRKIKGYWLLTPKSENETEIIYQVHGEPGGTVPDIIANTFVTDSPFRALKNLKQKAAEAKYQNSELSKVIE